jgi:hypothetical protein
LASAGVRRRAGKAPVRTPPHPPPAPPPPRRSRRRPCSHRRTPRRRPRRQRSSRGTRSAANSDPGAAATRGALPSLTDAFPRAPPGSKKTPLLPRFAVTRHTPASAPAACAPQRGPLRAARAAYGRAASPREPIQQHSSPPNPLDRAPSRRPAAPLGLSHRGCAKGNRQRAKSGKTPLTAVAMAAVEARPAKQARLEEPEAANVIVQFQSSDGDVTGARGAALRCRAAAAAAATARRCTGRRRPPPPRRLAALRRSRAPPPVPTRSPPPPRPRPQARSWTCRRASRRRSSRRCSTGCCRTRRGCPTASTWRTRWV